MYEINNVNKRLRAIRNFSNYVLVALVISVLTAIIVLAANGYDIDRNTGQVIQNGILLVETTPEDASVTLNGEPESATTPAKYPLPQGSYSLELEKEGYRSWSSSVEIFGSRVNWLYYPKLVPQTINTSIVDTVNSLNTFAYNQERDTLLLGRESNVRSLVLYDIGGNTVQATPYTVREAALRLSDGQPRGEFTLSHWSDNGRYAVFVYTGSNFRDTVLVDFDDPAQTFNLDTRYEQNFESVSVEQGVLHIVNDNDYYEVPVGAAELPEPSRDNVESIVHENGNTYLISRNPIGRRFLVSTNTSETLLELQPDTTVIRGEWEGTRFTAVSAETEAQIYGQLAGQVEPVPAKIIETEEPIEATQSAPSDRLVAVITKSTTHVYDLDTKKTHEISVGSDQSIAWLDDYRLSFEQNGQLYIMDFTGQNRYQITGYDTQYPAFADSEGSAIYTISKTTVAQSLVIRASSLQLKEN